jgi:2-dehydro-3-deoxyphosphooctonate aldolase (KDO 8-P synthase)
MEVHPDPDRAKSDAPNSIRLDRLETVLETCLAVWEAVHE